MARTNEWTEETKVCSKCGETKPLSEFHKQPDAKDGCCSHCKQCKKEYAQKYYQENREKLLANSHKWSYENRNLLADRKLQCRFGVSLKDYEEMLKIQGGGCAICGKTPEENGKRLAVDHSHKTGEVRGLLCMACNAALGYLQDDSELCERALLYLKFYGA